MTDFFKDAEKMTGGGTYFKFANIGDAVHGEFVSSSIKDAHEDFPEKKEYTLLVDGEEVIASISTKKTWVTEAADKAQPGDELGFKFSGLGGKNGKAKNMDVFIKAKATDGKKTDKTGAAGDDEELSF